MSLRSSACFRAFLSIFAGIVGLAAGVAPATSLADDVVDFNRQVRPILAKNCFACHGPDAESRQAGLRLDQPKAAQARLESGAAAIVPGKTGESELIARITAADESLRMPPVDSGHQLSPQQIATLQQWIAAGAKYAPHWSLVPPVRPEPPAVSDADWSRNAIDRFILQRLERAHLAPNGDADRHALVRRLSLDLRGLPPTPDEVRAFVEDTQPDAYERLVDRFLADKAYGERWARMWLDLARYADSRGYGSDPLRPNAWRFRDWVIEAFNRNQPFDRFTIEQLAGDLLENPTLEQRMATAFHRNTMTNTEGGTDDEEFRVAAVKDRVDTTMQVWMGLTAGCAQCHSHKYDPLTQAEYYSLFAIFNQTADADRGDEAPVMDAPTPEILAQLKTHDARKAELEARLRRDTPELAAEQQAWEATLALRSEWITLRPDRWSSQPIAVEGAEAAGVAAPKASTEFEVLDDGSIRAAGDFAGPETYVVSATTPLRNITAYRLEALPDAALPGGGSGRAGDGNFVLSQFSIAASPASSEQTSPLARFVRIEAPGAGRMLSLAEVQVFRAGKNLALHGQAAQSSTDYDGPARLAIDGNTDGHYFQAKSTTHTRIENDPWWEVDLGATGPIEQVVVWNRTDGNLQSRLAKYRVRLLDEQRNEVWKYDEPGFPDPHQAFSPTGATAVTLARAAADYTQPNFDVMRAIDGKPASTSGWAVGSQVDRPHAAVFLPSQPTPGFDVTRLTFSLEHRYQQPGYKLGRFRISATDDPAASRRAGLPADVLAIVDRPAEERDAPQSQRLRDFFRTQAASLQPLRDEIAALDKARPTIPTLPIMQELPPDKHRTTHVMVKGNFLVPGDKVEPAAPRALHPRPESVVDRLALARWLVARDNPLTARVTANRFWSQIFGRGLVETEEDFGTQGELPSHPELLDWLAIEFMEKGWDVKRLLKTIVTSRTYRQAAHVRPDHLRIDPANILIGRAPRIRLEAEMVRDQALALSGLLSSKSFGPSVFPPQPAGLWQAAFNGERTWPTSTGEDRYRRGLYVFWRRTVPYPSMAAFDAPSREVCALRRIRTNTPLQAFVTLNDPAYVEAAQALGRRIVNEGGPSTADRVRFALELCLARPATAQQIDEVVQLWESTRAHYRAHPDEAIKLATDPLGPLPEGAEAADFAAWTVVANMLLNLDAVLTRS